MAVRPFRQVAVAAVLLATLGTVGCAGIESSPGTASGNDTGAPDELGGELRILAAASLTGAFDELADQFEAQHPDLDVRPISYDGSAVLATQLIGGAPADVFASADEINMTKVTDASLADDPRIFATNILQIAVAPDNPLGIENLADLSDADLTVVVCAPEVPCGHASQALLGDADLTLAPASEEQNVTAVLAKVKSGEADAGVVYRTDVSAAAGAVTGIPIDTAAQATNVYPLVALNDAANPDAAASFIAFVLSDSGQQVLADFGFGSP